MCHLYGFRATSTSKVDCGLNASQAAMLSGAASDPAGQSPYGGRGIAFYADRFPEHLRQVCGEAEWLLFSPLSERVQSDTVVAHLRKGTVGAASKENCHPFVFGRWTFAHHGVVTALQHVGPKLVSETDHVLQLRRRGETDSEQLFFWLLSRLRAAGVDLAGHPRVEQIESAVACGLLELENRCRDAGGSPPVLNIILTDGVSMVASRCNSDLYVLPRHGLSTCPLCGQFHAIPVADHDYRAVVIASERISDEPWICVPDGHILSVDAGVNVQIRPMADACQRPTKRSHVSNVAVL